MLQPFRRSDTGEIKLSNRQAKTQRNGHPKRRYLARPFLPQIFTTTSGENTKSSFFVRTILSIG